MTDALLVLDRTADTPLHTQIRRSLRSQIESGGLAEGARLPSVKELTRTYNTSLGTIQRAIRELENEGLVKGVRGSGIYVTESSQHGQRTNHLKVTPIEAVFKGREIVQLLHAVQASVPGAKISFGNDHADVITMNADDIVVLADELVEVSDLIASIYGRSADELDMFGPLQLHGQSFMVPMVLDVTVIACNQTLFEEHGIPLPRPGWTWEDLLEIAQAMTCPEEGRYGFYPHHFTELWMTAVWQNGGRVFTADGRHALVDSDASMAFARFLRKLAPCAHPMTMDCMAKSMPGINAFSSGKVAMIPGSVWFPERLRRQKQSVPWTACPLPRGDREAGVLHAKGFGLCKTSPARKLAKRFCRIAAQWEKWPDKAHERYGLPLHTDMEQHNAVESAYKYMVAHSRLPLSDIRPECRSHRQESALKLLGPACYRIMTTREPVEDIIRQTMHSIDVMLLEESLLARGR